MFPLASFDGGTNANVGYLHPVLVEYVKRFGVGCFPVLVQVCHVAWEADRLAVVSDPYSFHAVLNAPSHIEDKGRDGDRT